MTLVAIYDTMWGTWKSKSLIRENYFDELGLQPWNGYYEFEIIDEKLFFLSVIKYGITYKNIKKNYG